ncbi:flagellar biosynthetic protein FliQ [Weizmannia acidilactici]|uniref:Flagellar biosynthetic protein FliQ n=1 Tax=Weizmannia acidilactici TaxID=2607726 RepID=A0A5J4JAS5_9BACI|nr:flagellar biosynthesis protein FliQ [Weizmannia acidilactici]GER65637.1 flagellar biosynthetic protein FliQ [Weizmannia acidilactici]GER69033.1 flagellar biosynthetic protein FliQ [Weizmannia acidilactici]GER71994.1 flagellar biosynthetic protein FliQ [Weizmannia acidilactici]
MSEEMVISLAEKGVMVTLLVCGPLLLIALVVGVIVSVFQAATQIQEQTLAFIPKIVAVLLGLILLGPWMLSHMLSYTKEIFTNLTQYIG